MVNKWIEHIKKFAKENNTSYGCALSNPKCKETYKNPKLSLKQNKPIINSTKYYIRKKGKGIFE